MSSLAGESRPNGRYTLEEKVTFLEESERTGSVAAATAAAGIAHNIGYQWARKAGVELKRAIRGRRESSRQLRSDGARRAEAARQVGVNCRTAQDWDQGIRHTQNRRLYPDGRVIVYNGGMNSPRSSAAVTTLTTLEAVIDPRYLSLPQRKWIRDLIAIGASVRSVAESLGRSPSMVSREIRRNVADTGTYEPWTAHRLAAERRPRPKDSKLLAPWRRASSDPLS
jgi:IS30 family transposase